MPRFTKALNQMCPGNVAFVGRRHLKKYRLLISTFLIVVFIGVAAGLMRRHRPGDIVDDVVSLDPASPGVRTIYYDPRILLRHYPSTYRPTRADLVPMVVRYAKVEHVPFEQIRRTVQQDFKRDSTWHMATPPGFDDYIDAYKGPRPTGMSEPDAICTVSPTHPAIRRVFNTSSKPTGYAIIQARKLSSWEVLWLRVKSVGKNPYATEEEIDKINE